MRSLKGERRLHLGGGGAGAAEPSGANGAADAQGGSESLAAALERAAKLVSERRGRLTGLSAPQRSVSGRAALAGGQARPAGAGASAVGAQAVSPFDPNADVDLSAAFRGRSEKLDAKARERARAQAVRAVKGRLAADGKAADKPSLSQRIERAAKPPKGGPFGRGKVSAGLPNEGDAEHGSLSGARQGPARRPDSRASLDAAPAAEGGAAAGGRIAAAGYASFSTRRPAVGAQPAMPPHPRRSERGEGSERAGAASASEPHLPGRGPAGVSGGIASAGETVQSDARPPSWLGGGRADEARAGEAEAPAKGKRRPPSGKRVRAAHKPPRRRSLRALWPFAIGRAGRARADARTGMHTEAPPQRGGGAMRAGGAKRGGHGTHAENATPPRASASARAGRLWPLRGRLGGGGRRDPAPSRLSYRLHRLWLRPRLRRFVLRGLPALLLAWAAGAWLAQQEHQDALRSKYHEILASIEARPEFTVSRMEILGASDAVAEDIREIMPVDLPASVFDLDLEAMKARIGELGAVGQADLRIRKGGVLELRITERHPVAVWRYGNDLVLLDAEGHRVAVISSRLERPRLPLLAGAGAEDAVPEALELLAAAAPVAPRIRGLVRIGERRWDLVLDGNQRILLPERDPVPALQKVMALDRAQDLLARAVQVVDMRNPARPTLRLAPGAAPGLVGAAFTSGMQDGGARHR